MTDDEAERIEREEHEFAEHTRQTNQAWRDRWPAFFRARGGWGGAWFNQSHPYGAGSATETLFDPRGDAGR
jgi:hypothetical protein